MSYGIVALVNAISQDVVQNLALSGYPALTEGQILLGRQHQIEQSAPPRIVMTPTKSTFRARDSSSVSWLNPPAPGGNAGSGVGLRSVLMQVFGSGYTSASVSFTGGGGTGAAASVTIQNGAVINITLTNAGTGYTSTPTVVIAGDGAGASAKAFLLPPTEYQTEAAWKALYTEDVFFEVRCWGIIPIIQTGQAVSPMLPQGGPTPPPDDPDTDFDFTQALYQQVIRSCHHLAVGSFELIGHGGGMWTDSKIGSSQFFRTGREFVFQLALSVPVLDQLLPYAPTGTGGSITVQALDPAGTGDVINEVVVATS